jgi:hypothetical protein
LVQSPSKSKRACTCPIRTILAPIAAFDDTTLEQLWKINVGSGFTAPPMTYEFGGKQYVAIASGASTVAISLVRQSPQLSELREMRHATVLYVFGL